VFRTLSATARAVTFYLTALIMCVALALTWPNGEAAAVLAMLTPMLAVLVMQFVVTRDGWRRDGWAPLGLRRLRMRFWPVAVALCAAVLLFSEAVLRLTALTTWHVPGAVDSSDLLVELPVMLVLVFFEEIGWRGYLGPLLVATGRRVPHLLTGFLHGVWHLPLVFFATGGYLTEGNRWVVVPIFLAVLTCAGQLYGWIREISGSVYPVVIMHTSFNMGLTIAVIATATGSPGTVALVGREAGVVTLAAVAAAALWVSTRRAPVGSPADAPPVTVPVGT
jgi:uncharacterized protein